MSDTPISPSAGAITLAGIALTLVAGTVTLRTPTIGSVALAGVAPTLVQQLQTPDTLGTVNLLKGDSQTGIIKYWPGGSGLLSCVGTWGGATVTLNWLAADQSTWLAVGSSTTLTSNGAGSFSLPPSQIQAVISNAGSTSLTAAAQVVPTRIA